VVTFDVLSTVSLIMFLIIMPGCHHFYTVNMVFNRMSVILGKKQEKQCTSNASVSQKIIGVVELLKCCSFHAENFSLQTL
jgi:hypothetical protein